MARRPILMGEAKRIASGTEPMCDDLLTQKFLNESSGHVPAGERVSFSAMAELRDGER